MRRKKARKKATWMRPRSRRWHLLDYVLIRRRDRQELLLTKAIRDADGWTDHHLPFGQLQASMWNRHGIHLNTKLKMCHLDDTPVRSVYLDRLLKLSQEAESLSSQLPPQNTEAEMARQDYGYGSHGADWNPQHIRHAEASATVM
ncbi:unnamed protein product [Schistocephalus solidus]|uniref:HTH LytTR-type domain-containing protein n=1 Tax=Schistocephalus solidus TaxID=70667 RepID=A0A183SBW4_SCHSO|nr:unnamed protein product [Schistocephalus solidus]